MKTGDWYPPTGPNPTLISEMRRGRPTSCRSLYPSLVRRAVRTPLSPRRESVDISEVVTVQVDIEAH